MLLTCQDAEEEELGTEEDQSVDVSSWLSKQMLSAAGDVIVLCSALAK